MTYIDGFVLVVPQDKMDEYRKMAQTAGQVWKDHGALQYVESIAEDTEDKRFCQTFPQLAQPRDGEVVIFSYITYNSRAHRDEVNAKVMTDPRIKDSCDPDNMPFDCKRMTYGGFESIVEF